MITRRPPPSSARRWATGCGCSQSAFHGTGFRIDAAVGGGKVGPSSEGIGSGFGNGSNGGAGVGVVSTGAGVGTGVGIGRIGAGAGTTFGRLASGASRTVTVFSASNGRPSSS